MDASWKEEEKDDLAEFLKNKLRKKEMEDLLEESEETLFEKYEEYSYDK